MAFKTHSLTFSFPQLWFSLLLGAGALGRPRGMVWGGRREEGSGWGTCGGFILMFGKTNTIM